MRRSVALLRVRPVSKALAATACPAPLMAGARRWDSARSRRSSRSWARREGASSGSAEEEEVAGVVDGSVLREVWSGGRDDWVDVLI